MSNLQQRVQLLERKIEREKRARKAAESQLEEYSRQIFLANQSLQNALDSQKKRSIELEYLASSSAKSATDHTLEELIRYFVELTSHFCEAEIATFYMPASNQTESIIKDNLWIENVGWCTQPNLGSTIQQCLPPLTEEATNDWLICPADLTLPNHSKVLNWIYYLSFHTENNSLGWLALLSDKEYIDEDMLYVLNTSKEHLINGIKRHLVEARIIRRNSQLQETVEKLKAAQRQLVQSEKMAVLGQLAAGVAHEINNPIAYIKSNLQVLREYWESLSNYQESVQYTVNEQGYIDKQSLHHKLSEIDYDFLKEDADEILISALDGVKRVKEIVLGLKTFTHQGGDNFICTNIADCIDNAVKMANSGISANTIIETKVDPPSIEIQGNPGQIQQVIINLLVNADHAMQPDGGNILVKCYQREKRVIVEISDTGCGMDDEAISKLFTPFFTTKAVGEGTGLGLSVSFAILEAHQATIDVISTPNKGSTFTLSFPELDLSSS